MALAYVGGQRDNGQFRGEIGQMRIAFLVEEGATASSVAVTLDMLRLAQRFDAQGGWTPRLFSAQGGAIGLIDGLSLTTEPLPEHLEGYDALLMTGFFADTLDQLYHLLQSRWAQNVARLSRLPPHTLVAASCHGTFVLAQAGLLDGMRATTTWWFAREFQQRYPRVLLDADKAMVDGGRVLTAGAMTAHGDLVLQMLRRLGGVALARAVARIMLIDGARASQRPFKSLPQQVDDALVQQAIGWMVDRLHCPPDLQALAGAMPVSYRTLNRRFTALLGCSLLAYYQALKIEQAKAWLEAGEEFSGITYRLGYEDVSSFRRLFRRETGLSPSQYRKQFHRAE